MRQQQGHDCAMENLMLAVLPADEYDLLAPHFELVALAQGQVIYESGELIRRVYFPTGGMFSLLATTSEGAVTEVAMVGNEGMVGMPVIWGINRSPYRVMAQVAGSTLAMKAVRLQDALKRQGKLHGLLLRHTYLLICQISQSAVCNRFHTVEQRLGRWLLITQDRTKSERYRLTQDLLSHMLGSGRQRVNAVVRSLQQEGLIRYVRGQITILDRSGLEAISCECYRLIKPLYEKAPHLI
jgi:CRP-like cAMP-binding protein